MYAQVDRSWQLGMLAKDMARGRLRRKRAGDQDRLPLVERMGALHGLPQKIGQILSLSELSREDQTYTPLTEYRATLPAPAAFAEMEKQLGRPLDAYFRQMDDTGISASIGQVHRAVLHDGRKVAVKVQYPDIAESVRLDLRALGWLTAPMGGLKRGFDLKSYQREVGSMLEEELDYRHEALMIKQFAASTAEWDDVEVPAVIEELSGDRILTMTWVEGEPFSAVRRWPAETRRQLSRTLLRLFLAGCFRWGTLHADPHPGNYRFRQQNGRATVGLLDFGCVKRIDEDLRNELAGLLEDVIEGRIEQSADRALARYAGMGFRQDMLEPIAHLLAPLSRVLFEPFHAPQPFSLASWSLGKGVEQILGNFRWNFRFAGPAHLIFLVRAYQGLIQYLQALDTPIDWREAWEETRQDCTPSLEPAQSARQESRGAMKSKSLRIRVSENKRMKVDLTFGARCAENLSDLIPPELQEKLRQRSIDIDETVRKVVASDFEPMELFQLEEGSKSVRVWLE